MSIKLKIFVCLEYLLNVEKNLLDKQLAEISVIRKNSLIVITAYIVVMEFISD